MPKDSLAADTWLPLLPTRTLGRGEIVVLEETPSTNTLLREMARCGAPAGSLCLAECQTAGKGRLGRSWHSPAGQGLWLSVLLRPELSPEQTPWITFCAAMAMANAIRSVTGLEIQIKWPNDLVLQGKKLCGILSEAVTGAKGVEGIVVGTGLNVGRNAYPPELAHQATSLEDHITPPQRHLLLVSYLTHLEQLVEKLEQHGIDALKEAYSRQSCTLGHFVRVTGSVTMTGIAEALDETGALLVRDDQGELHRVLAGDVSIRGVMGYV